MLRPFLLTSVLAAACLAPAAAQAGEPFTVGEGSNPHLLTHADGNAQIVWADDVADKVHFCAIPRGERECFLSRTLDAPFAGLGPDRPFLVRGAGATLHIAMAHHSLDQTWLWTSANGGNTWSGPTKIYSSGEGTGAEEPMLTSTGLEILFPNWNPGQGVWAAKTDASENAGTAVAELPDGGNGELGTNLQVASTGGVSVVATAEDGENVHMWRHQAGDWSSEANWSLAPTLVGAGDTSRLAGGQGGPYLMTTVGAPGDRHVEMRRWTGTQFGVATKVADEEGYINDVTVSPSGGVGAIWRRNDSPNRLRFALSTNTGATWAVSTIALEDVVMRGMDVALANDNQGWAVYEGRNSAQTAAKREIRVATTEPVAEPQKPATPATTPATPPQTTPTTPPPPRTNGTKPVEKSTSAFRRITSSVRGATLELSVPTQCIPAGKPFTVRLGWQKQKRKGNLFVKVSQARFFIGKTKLKTDRSAPFSQTLTIPQPVRGREYRLRTQAVIKVRRGRSPKKSVFATLRVCA